MIRHPLASLPWAVRPRLGRPANHRLALLLRLATTEPEGEPVRGEFARDGKLASVEAALFLADEPLAPRKIAVVAGLKDAAEARQLLGQLSHLYEAEGSAFQIQELGGGFQLMTRPEFHHWLSRLRRNAPEVQLSAAARETLTIIAYRQPVTCADIEAIRGVGSRDVLKQLMEKGLVKMGGRDDSLGRPVLYETTKQFLQMFGMRGLKDLPPVEGVR